MKDNFDLAPAQWNALRRLLDTALELPPAQRATWLDNLAAEYDPLKPRLRALLEQAAAGTGALPLATLPKVETAQFLADRAGTAGAHELQPEQCVGPYRLIRLLGEGGMGAVWLAERSDMLQRRQVALKLPRLLTGRTALAERLAREREILAALNHPNIARLYDAGITDDGQPYLALEYVEGESIDAYCVRKGLDVPARLRLFLQVARAVAHAHANLVVHRDLKPGNILVTESGEVRLLDFGIAKLLDDGRADETELTQVAGRALTPDYASPEQILGQPVATSADVYALGVVLFELLTGQRPYRLRRESRAALEEAIVQVEPPRPSAVVADAKARRRLRGDLDTIVGKALKKDPGERYRSVEALAEDIERHLQQRPVLAQPDSRAYRVGRFLARNRLAAAAAAAVMLAILAGASAALWQAHVAVREQQRAQEVKDFVAAIFREAGPYSGAGGAALSAIDLLKLADQRLGRSMVEQPQVRVELSALIGESLMSFGDFDAAEPILNRAADDARHALGTQHEQTIRILLLQAQIHRLRGRAAEARAMLDQILPALRAQRATRPIDLAGALAHRTLIALEEAAYDDAERLAAEGASVAATRLGADDDQTIASSILLALAYRYTKKFELSRDAAEKAYRAALARYGQTPPHARVVEAKTTYGRALADTGDLAAGIALIDSAAADARVLIGPDSPQVGLALQNLVAYRIDLGELALAERNAAEALRIVSQWARPESQTFAGTLSALAQARLARRDAAAALADFGRAAPILERVIGPDKEATLIARTGEALALAWVGRSGEAQERIEAVAARIDGGDVPPALRARVAHVRATVARQRGDLDGALSLQQPVTASLDPAPKMQRERMRARVEVGLVRLERGDASQAAAWFEQALQDSERLESGATPTRADAQIGLARARLAQGRAAEALPLLAQANAYWRDAGPDSRWAGEAAFWLGRCHAALGQAAAARQAYARAATALARSPLRGDTRLAQLARAG